MNKIKNLNPSRFIGEGALIIMTIIWGGTFVIVKESLNDISPIFFVALRFGIAGAIIALIMFFKKLRIEKKDIMAGLFLGVFLFLGFVLQTIGLKHTSATKSGFLTGSLVVMVPFLQMIIEKKLPSRGALVGTVFVFIGILFLSSGDSSITTFLGNLGATFNLGDGLTLACAFFFAFQVVCLDIFSKKYDFWILFVTQLLSVSILAFIASGLFHVTSMEVIYINYSNNLIIGFLYTILLATCLNFGLQTKFQKRVSPTKAGIIYSFEPIFAALFAFFLLSEKISNFGLVGCILIFSGLIISEIFDTLLPDGKRVSKS